MALPKLSDFRNTLPEKDDSWCQLFKKYIHLSVLVYFYFKYRYNSEGKISDEFAAELCAARGECNTTT